MERAIMEANKNKLHSANKSSVRQGELAQIITDNDYNQWERFLKGELAIPGHLDEGTRRWLNTFNGIQIDESDMTVTTKEYMASWNAVKERTSSAPGQTHFGTFKAARWCAEAAELNTILANIPIQTGHIPPTWKHSVDSMIPKKPGKWRPHKLRLTSLLSTRSSTIITRSSAGPQWQWQKTNTS